MKRWGIVGCQECHHFWIVEDLRRQDTVECPRCGDVRDSSLVRVQAKADSWRVACEKRARLLARQADQHETYVHNWDDFGVLEDEIETSVATTAPDEPPLFTGAFADEAAEHLEQWSEQRREVLQDEAEAYLDRRFATITPETDAGDGPDRSLDELDNDAGDITVSPTSDVRAGVRVQADYSPSELWSRVATSAGFQEALVFCTECAKWDRAGGETPPGR